MNKKIKFQRSGHTITSIILSIVIVLISIATEAKSGETEVITWINQDAYLGEFTGQIAPDFCKWIEKNTNGKLVIEHNTPNSIVPVRDMYAAVIRGTIDFAGTYYSAFYRGSLPESDIEEIPILFGDPIKQWDFIWNSGYYEIISEIYRKKGIKWFPVIIGSTYSIGFTSDIISIEDIKGKKIRGSAGIFQDYLVKLGASPVVLPFGDIYMALSTGAIDGLVGGIGMSLEYKLNEVTKTWVNSPNPSNVTGDFLINLQKWNELPKQTRDFIENNFKLWNWQSIVRCLGYETKAKVEGIKKGLKFLDFPADDVKSIEKIFIDLLEKQRAKGDVYKEIVELSYKYMKENGVLKYNKVPDVIK